MIIFGFFREFLNRRRARRAASEACRLLFPSEPVVGAHICADEPTRYVVRVFFGKNTQVRTMRPAWKGWLIFAVLKDSLIAEQIKDDGKYRPAVR